MGKFYIRCLFTGFLDSPIFRKSGKSEHPKTRIFGFSGNSEIRFPKIRISGNPKIRIFRFPDFRISENLDFRKSENPDFRLSRFSRAPDVEFSGASDARLSHRMGPDPSKKHGDAQSTIHIFCPADFRVCFRQTSKARRYHLQKMPPACWMCWPRLRLQSSRWQHTLQ